MQIQITIAYRYAQQTSAPPSAGTFRRDAADWQTTARIWLATVTDDGRDASTFLQWITPGTGLYFQEQDNAAHWVTYRTTAAPILQDGYVELPVTYHDGGGSAPSNNQVCELYTAVTVGSTDAPGGPSEGLALVDFYTAKDHLRVTDSAHDDEIASKLAIASAIIVDYLKGRADPTWDEDTTPLPVQAAILNMLSHLYEHRGDDFAPDDHSTAVWRAVELLLERFRDPALA